MRAAYALFDGFGVVIVLNGTAIDALPLKFPRVAIEIKAKLEDLKPHSIEY